MSSTRSKACCKRQVSKQETSRSKATPSKGASHAFPQMSAHGLAGLHEDVFQAVRLGPEHGEQPPVEIAVARAHAHGAQTRPGGQQVGDSIPAPLEHAQPLGGVLAKGQEAVGIGLGRQRRGVYGLHGHRSPNSGVGHANTAGYGPQPISQANHPRKPNLAYVALSEAQTLCQLRRPRPPILLPAVGCDALAARAAFDALPKMADETVGVRGNPERELVLRGYVLDGKG